MSQDSKPVSAGSSDLFFFSIVALLCLGLLARLLGPALYSLKQFYFAHAFKIRLCAFTVVSFLVLMVLGKVWNYFVGKTSLRAVTKKDPHSVFLGVDMDTGQDVHLKEDLRTTHMQVIGSTNAGKTSAVILPLIVQDIEQGRGMIIVDGKSEKGFLETLYGHVVRNKREKDFLVFSLANPAISSTYNPLTGGSPEQITERVFSSFKIDHAFYGPIQLAALHTLLELFAKRHEVPMPGVFRALLRDRQKLTDWAAGLADANVVSEVQAMVDLEQKTFEERYAGLVTMLGQFSLGDTRRLFNTRRSEIDFTEIIKQGKICYFQLPTMQYRTLGEATGRLVLQHLQSVISEIQVNAGTQPRLFSIYLDDFNDYIYPGFGSLLNKARSANVGVVFSHQSLGDLDKVSPDFKQIVSTNTNLKVVMRSNDPASAEHFAKIIGTRTVEKATSRRSKTFFGWKDAGEQSVRATEEYIVHPNELKSILGRGEAVVVIPHPKGTTVKRVRCYMAPRVETATLPTRNLPDVDFGRASMFQAISTTQINSLPVQAT